MIKLLFGKIGSGKSYIGQLAQERYGYVFHDMDWDLPTEMKESIERHDEVTQDMRDQFTIATVDRIRKLKEKNDRICISQALFKNQNRVTIQSELPDVDFIWVDAREALISERLKKRTGFTASAYYANLINPNFEIPTIKCTKFMNSAVNTEFYTQMECHFGNRGEPGESGQLRSLRSLRATS